MHSHLRDAHRLLRVYTPGEWKNTALTFRRRGGPLLCGIPYSAPTLEGCLVEVFGDDGLISTQDRQLGSLLVRRSLQLLDLRAAVRPDPTASSMATPTTVQTPWALFERADGALTLEACRARAAVAASSSSLTPTSMASRSSPSTAR